MASAARFSSFNQFNDALLGYLAEECFQRRLERLAALIEDILIDRQAQQPAVATDPELLALIPY
jgi:hypothetical protein